MPETVVVRGSGGSLFAMDLPTRAHAADLFWQRVESGDLTIVTDPVEWFDDFQNGSRKLRLVVAGAPAEAPAEAPVVARERRKPGRPPKVRVEQETPAEGSDLPEE